ncbi:MAG: lytic transglycosylase domain-containing protein [Alphaproteobacteria bacterium]|nr:lytic transglycosylase domain-containing protein [Alphaproteobacteria bacterium]
MIKSQIKNWMIFCGLVLSLFSNSAFSEEVQKDSNTNTSKETFIESSSTSVLSNLDKDLYKQIFKLLQISDFDGVNMLLKDMKNDILKGYVQAYMFEELGTKSKRQDLTNWLYKNYDLPIFNNIYDIAVKVKAFSPYKRKNDKTQHIVAGVCTSTQIADPTDLIHIRRGSYIAEQYRAKVKRSLAYFSTQIRRGKTLAAKLHLNDRTVQKHLSQRDKDDLSTSLAYAYFIDRRDSSAWDTIKGPVSRATDRNPMAPWVAGLTKFRLGEMEEAEKYFKMAANHPKAIPTLKAGASFWATRALMKQEKYRDILPLLKQAALAAPYSFYGILAQRALGWDITHNWKGASITPDIHNILKYPAGRRMIALIEIGQVDLAEDELLKLYTENKKLRPELQAYADTLTDYPDFRELLAGLDGSIETKNGDKALYPIPNWEPDNGWRMDRALVYAFIRQESCFKNKAFSKAGARGVMQLMPGTARLMANKLHVKYARSKLHNISYSLMLGQELIKTLLNFKSIQGNLFMTIASYNCGAGNTSKWQQREDLINDPVMFVEAIPSRETRDFVKKVVANYWVYRSLMGEDLSSVDDVLAGIYPIYLPKD